MEHSSILFCISVTTSLEHIYQMFHNVQDIFIKETNYLQNFHLILFNLPRQFYLSLASLQTMILIGRILSLLILLLIWHLIDLLLLLTYSQNSIAVIILISSWLTYLVNLQTLSMLIKLPVLILIQGKLKLISPTLLVALNLISSIIFCFNVISTFTLILCNST